MRQNWIASLTEVMPTGTTHLSCFRTVSVRVTSQKQAKLVSGAVKLAKKGVEGAVKLACKGFAAVGKLAGGALLKPLTGLGNFLLQHVAAFCLA